MGHGSCARRQVGTKLSLRGSVDKQAQQGPDQLKKSRAVSNGDRSARPSKMKSDKPLGDYIPILINRNSIG